MCVCFFLNILFIYIVVFVLIYLVSVQCCYFCCHLRCRCHFYMSLLLLLIFWPFVAWDELFVEDGVEVVVLDLTVLILN